MLKKVASKSRIKKIQSKAQCLQSMLQVRAVKFQRRMKNQRKSSRNRKRSKLLTGMMTGCLTWTDRAS